MRTIQTAIEIEAPPKVVWDNLVDFPAHGDWNPFFASIDGPLTVGEKLMIVARKGEGTGMTFRPVVLKVEPNRLLKWRGQLLVRGLFDGTHSFELKPSPNGGTTLNHAEEFRGVLVRLVGKVLDETESGFVALNVALKERCESGSESGVGRRGCRAGWRIGSSRTCHRMAGRTHPLSYI